MKALALAVASAALLAQSAPQAPADGPILRGTVVTDDGGRPVRRAAVSLVDAATGVSRIDMSDDAGRFSFGILPGAEFSIVAAKLGFVTTYHGSAKPGRKPGQTLRLPGGERALALTIKMIRTASIAGRVTDPLGQPLPGATIEVSETQGPSAARMLTPALVFSEISRVTSDGNGDYRFWGLAPGSYIVKVSFVPAAPGPTRRATTAADIQWAQDQMRPGAMAQPPPAPFPALEALAGNRGAQPNAKPAVSVYYPDGSDPSGAATIGLRAGEDRGGVDIVLRVKTVAGSH